MENLSYKWKLSETNFEKNKGKVFSCFACGGGSTMGYKTEVILCSTFPLDYDFLDQQPHYICGMSVPSLMIAKISNEVYKQFLSKL